MLNQVVLVGRLTKNVEVQEGKEGSFAILSLAIPRAFKNEEGIYETDFIDCKAFNMVATNTAEYCKKGDIVGVKGRLQTEKIDDKNVIYVMGEKVTFLSSSKSE